MHIVDGALSAPVVITGGVIAAGGIALGLRALTLERIPAAGVLSATFFVAALIHVPIGPSSVHLIMNGLAGLVLGWAAFPALFVGLLLQAVFFGFGGVTVLGVNTVNIALPAVLVGLMFRGMVTAPNVRVAAFGGLLAGASAIIMTALIVALTLWLSGDAFIPAAKLVVLAHLPVAVIEGVICAAAVILIHRVKPDLFGVMGPAPNAARPA
ncbi:cobalt transporter CbiM [Roseospira marina]|uniref:Cobalt transporter CbiM n=1 Tax=Roseospira marina TaxID=140057 RepID=A0A5M6IBI4_9PROT|nr:cobalt transporter CbiM [Roseospira marina]KAA5605616.1 cobalt transporter CbiM [Roseospira marina]MBB4313313.1 cobalt/nickel transport system permease protein [Roseospira marina]MBB5085946.1 cobalt/nickel transport system permease protein [Roseospira marina]